MDARTQQQYAETFHGLHRKGARRCGLNQLQ
jgi:hypothetical protein